MASTTGFDTITDFTVGATGDKIDVGAASSIAANAGATTTAKTGKITAGTVTFNAADDTLAEKITAVEAAINASSGGGATDGEAAVFTDSGNTYVFISEGTDGVGAGDALISLGTFDASSLTLTSEAGGNDFIFV